MDFLYLERVPVGGKEDRALAYEFDPKKAVTEVEYARITASAGP